MEVQQLKTMRGAARFGTCSECLKSSKDDPNMWRLTFGTYSINLCEECFYRVGTVLGKYAEARNNGRQEST